MLPDDDNYCVCCGDHPATVTWQGMQICAECKRGFDGRNNSALGEVVRRLCQDDPDRLETWADGVRDMWGGDLSRFLQDIATEMGRQEAEHEGLVRDETAQCPEHRKGAPVEKVLTEKQVSLRRAEYVRWGMIHEVELCQSHEALRELLETARNELGSSSEWKQFAAYERIEEVLR